MSRAHSKTARSRKRMTRSKQKAHTQRTRYLSAIYPNSSLNVLELFFVNIVPQIECSLFGRNDISSKLTIKRKKKTNFKYIIRFNGYVCRVCNFNSGFYAFLTSSE